MDLRYISYAAEVMAKISEIQQLTAQLNAANRTIMDQQDKIEELEKKLTEKLNNG